MKQLSKEEEYEIIRQVLDGKKQAYRLLVDQYKRYVYSAVYKIVGTTEDAEDCAQEAFVKAYRSLGNFQFQSKFSTWLYRIAVNTAISKRRKQKFYTTDINEVQINDSVKNANTLQQKEQKKYIKMAFEKMNESDASILSLFYLQELSLNEIADILEIEVNNAKVRLYRARKRLADELKGILHHEVKTIVSWKSSNF